MQVIAAVLASPLVVETLLAAGFLVVWAAAGMDTTGTVAGSTEVAADWPRSQNGRALSR